MATSTASLFAHVISGVNYDILFKFSRYAYVWCGLCCVNMCKLPGSCQGSDPGCNLGKLPESGGNPGEVPVSGLSGEFGSTCVVEGPNTWEATDGNGPGDVRVGWRMRIEGLVT